MKTDSQIQKNVMDELRWEPILNAAEIGVAVKNGVVTLSGLVDTYFKKIAAERAAKRVAGVKAVAEDIQVGVSPAFPKTDTEIAQKVIDALQWHSGIQEEKIKVKVEDGHVKLEGEVDWEYQRNSAKTAIEHLNGVRSVINFITIRPRVTPSGLEQMINAAFHRSATLDANKIAVEVEGGKVTLRGKVRSYPEKEDAEITIWNAPGVTSLESKLEVFEPEFELID